MMNRREALRALTLTSVATLATRWMGNDVLAADAASPAGTPAATPSETAALEPFVLPPLPYAANALEPHIDAMTMEIHHDKHHGAYVKNLNKAISAHPDLATMSVEDLLKDLNAIPDDIRTAVRNNGGGHANHSLFWKSLSPKGGGAPEGALADAINAGFGDFAKFQGAMTKAAMGVFGSGWAWLTLGADKKLMVESFPNQDSPVTQGRAPLLGIDVWEHAYYLHYQNRRADYVQAIWNVIDWQFVATRYAELVD